MSILPKPIKVDPLPEHLKGESEKILPSITNFLLQEVEKFNKFLSVIKNSLINLQKAIQGSVSMN